MKKELKDFAPFYLGCECLTPDGIMVLNGIYTTRLWFYCRWDDKKNCYLPKQNGETLCKQSLVGKSYKYSEVKPILRSLSDMTEEEEMEIEGEYGSYGLGENHLCNALKNQDLRYVKKLDEAFELTRNLLSKHFDLFGLIPAGLAIDKITLTTESNSLK